MCDRPYRAGTAFAIVFGILSCRLFALDPAVPLERLNLETWGVREGIPDETIQRIVQTADGYLWLATMNGVLRFDGSTPKVFQPGLTVGKQDPGFNGILAAADGRLVIGSYRGGLYEARPDTFGTLASPMFRLRNTVDSDPTSARAVILAIARQQEEKLLLLATPGGLLATGEESGGGMRRVCKTDEVADPREVRTVHIGQRGHLYLATIAGVIWKCEKGRWAERGRVTNRGIERLLEDRSGQLWIGAWQSVSVMEAGASQPVEILGEKHVSGLSGDLHEDRSGAIWVGTADSIIRISGGKITKLALPAASRGELVTAIFEDAEGSMWFGTDSGHLHRLQRSAFEQIGKEWLREERWVYAAHRSPDGAIWIGTREHGLMRWKDGVTQVIPNSRRGRILAISDWGEGGVLAVADASMLWANEHGARDIRFPRRLFFNRNSGLLRVSPDAAFVSTGAGIYRIERTGEQWRAQLVVDERNMRAMTLDEDGGLWMVGLRGGLKLFHKGKTSVMVDPQAIPDGQFFTLRLDGDVVWIGTSLGMFAYSRKTGGLMSNRVVAGRDFVFHIEKEEEDYLWLATRAGIVMVDRKAALEYVARGGQEPRLWRFGSAHGLPSLNFGLATSSSGFRQPDGRICLPSLHGLIQFHPREVRMQNQRSRTVVESVLADSSPLDLRRNLSVPAGTRTLQVVFNSLALRRSEACHFRYRLSGVDNGWVEGNGREARYTNLPPGQYRFEVQSSLDRVSWDGSLVALVFEIPPFFYQTGYFKAGVGLTVALLIGAGFWLNHRRLTSINKLLERRVAERTRELQKSKDAAESLSRIKSEFLATMSHEIRTPMTGVIGLASLLSGTELNQEQQELVSTIQASGESLLSVVNDILDYSKIEAGMVLVRSEPVVIADLLRSTLAGVEPLAIQKGIRLGVEGIAALPEKILVDPLRLRQILNNLLGNAIKFTSSGSVTMEISVTEAEGSRPGQWQVAVRDTGIGIPAEKLPQIFDRFVQVDSSYSRRFGGTGLGLAISLGLARAMGGYLSAESVFGKGSTFRLELPLVPASEDHVEMTPRGPRPIKETYHILLAEDNPVNQLFTKRVLESAHYQVTIASNGVECLEKIRENTFDLVLMDCQMPEMDGLEATRLIRAMGGQHASLPIVGLTANALAEDRDRCFEAGMNDYLAKPFYPVDLQDKLGQWIEKAKVAESNVTN